MNIYRVEQDAPKGSDYAECFFEVIAKSRAAAWRIARERADYRILYLWRVK